MRKFSMGAVFGLIIGLMLSFGITAAWSNVNVIKLIINGQEVKTDVPPQMVNGRVLVPARFVAEPLGATVEWKDNSVIINSKTSTGLPSNEQVNIPNEYFTPRQIANVLGDKYPNNEVVVGSHTVWFDKKEIKLPYIEIDRQEYWSVQPLIDASIINLNDFQ